MTRYTFFLRYALNGIKRGGQRIIIATLAVAFGVMSLISMADIADSIDRTLTSDPRVSLGGDLRLSNPTQEIFTTLQSLQDKGDISSYSHIQQAPFLLMRTANDGRANFVQSGIGINPATYPLVGDFVISQPAQVTPTDLLQEIGSALITRDLASKHQISIGDTIRIAQNDGTMATISLIVMGIISDTPEHTGSRIYYNLETSVQLLGNRGSIQDYVVINTDNPEHVKQQLNGQIQQVDLSTTTPSQSGAFFDFMLRGAGVLGLIVGGIGIANTMQVLLTQRRNEVGILKALGYSQRDMIVIFVLESMLIGLIGSFLGVVMALLLSQGLIQLFANISTLLVTWQLNMILILTSMLTGIATTIIFAFYAILRTSRTRPNVIFRRTLENQRTWQTRFQSLGFYGLLAIPFAGVTGLFLGSVIEGIGIVLFSIAGFLFLSLIIWFMMWAILRVLPTLRSNLLRIARNNMRKRISSMLFAMIALFVGIFTLGFALTVVQVGIDQFNERDASADAGYNILVYADTDTVSQIVELMPITQVDYRYVTSLHRDGTAVQIRQHTWDIEIVGGIEFGTQNGLYVADSSPLAIGDDVILNNDIQLPIIGRYRVIDDTIISPIDSLIMPSQTADSLDIAISDITIYAMVSADEEATLAKSIGAQFPNSMTLTRSDVMAEINGMFLNLLGFALAMSGLALLAGVMLIANVVSLAMLERYFELGLMKALGYTQKHILVMLAMEYSLIGLIASLMGLIGVQAVISFIILTQEASQGILFIRPTTAIVMILFGMALTMLTALITAWKPLRVRPSVVLKERVS